MYIYISKREICQFTMCIHKIMLCHPLNGSVPVLYNREHIVFLYKSYIQLLEKVYYFVTITSYINYIYLYICIRLYCVYIPAFSSGSVYIIYYMLLDACASFCQKITPTWYAFIYKLYIYIYIGTMYKQYISCYIHFVGILFIPNKMIFIKSCAQFPAVQFYIYVLKCGILYIHNSL